MNALPAASPASALSLDSLSDNLERHGWFVQADALPRDVARALAAYAKAVHEDSFHTARIGRGEDQQRNRFVRRDRIHWMDERDPVLAPWRAWTESLRLHLNRRLFLGLFSFESHLAHYAPGAFYRTHVDAFRGEANRVVSLVCYLNEHWLDGDGGELVLHTEDGPVTVEPRHGTVVLFLSEEIPHEVTAARRDRWSVAGWFRVNASQPERIDPPR